MATRGRKPKPTAMKELEGNPGKHPLNTSEPKPNKKAPACPKWLEPEAKKEWRRLAKQMEAIGILTEVDMAVAMLMIHDPSTVAMGNTKDMEKAIEVLNEVKESIINAYAAKSGLSHARIANLMSNETWMNAKKAVELGFADEILFAKKEEEPDSDPADPENPEEDPDSEPGEGEEKKPFQKDTAGHLFSSRQMDLIVLNRLGVKPEDVGQKHTEPKEPPADPKPSAEPTPPAEPPANSGPVLDLDGKTEDGSIPYNILMKQLECMK